MYHEKALEDFTLFGKVDLQLAGSTLRTYKSSLNILFSRVRKPITEDSIRKFLYDYSEEYPNKSTYATMLKAIKCFFKKYLKSDITDSFRYPRIPYHPKKVPTKKQLQEFYSALPSLKKKALFLFYASSGLRRGEILSMRMEDLDLDRRMIVPTIHTGFTKKSWIGFFNEEAKEILVAYLSKCKENPQFFRKVRVFNPAKNPTLWTVAREKTGLTITPKVFRDWFCCQMGELGVPDRYIDAFCGRVPRSVLARHYTDYSSSRLKRIYDKADLTILS